MDEKVYLVGELRFHSDGKKVQESESGTSKEFLLELQQLMDKWEVIRVDVAIDPTKYPK